MSDRVALREEQIHSAMHAWAACLDAKLNPELESLDKPYDGLAEFMVSVNGRGMEGIVHENIEKALQIASDHGGRAWIAPGGYLHIVWPIEGAPGPGEPSEKELAAERVRGRTGSPTPSGWTAAPHCPTCKGSGVAPREEHRA